MTALKLSQLLYRILIRLHPFSFRIRFQDEMIWVFEEQARHEKLSTLLLDGLRSLLVQHVNASHDVEPVQTGFTLEVVTSSLSSKRLVQAALGASAVTIGFALMLAAGPPIMPSAPSNVAVRHHYPSFCEEPVSTMRGARKDRFARKALPNRSK
jgi:hypothetical protein